MSSFPAGTPLDLAAEEIAFQSAVAHELISSQWAESGVTSLARFKALSRMSSFPAMEAMFPAAGDIGFKALSRMSSFPAATDLASSAAVYEGFKALSRMSSFPARFGAGTGGRARTFQSAVAHELISSKRRTLSDNHIAISRFKALSRMSSFPAVGQLRRHGRRSGFQSAVAHELISSSAGCCRQFQE